MKSLKSLSLRVLAALALSWTFAIPMHAANWFPLGPYGGDARCFAADSGNSKHLYLGTASGWIYESRDGGANWSRLSQIHDRNDLIIDHILTDARNPRRLVVGAWIVDHPDGGMFISEDGGKTWNDVSQMHGQSVRVANAVGFQPRYDGRRNLAGSVSYHGQRFALEPGQSGWKHRDSRGAVGCDRSEESADHLCRHVASAVERPSMAELTGKNIKQGIIEDSDVFSILVDPFSLMLSISAPCSGIYKSVNAGGFIQEGTGYSLSPLAARASSNRIPSIYRRCMRGPRKGSIAHWMQVRPGAG